MRWEKIDKKWQDWKAVQPGGVLVSNITYEIEQWPIPGEAPLDVRVCRRTAPAPHRYFTASETPKTSIVLHITAGYGAIDWLMGGADHSCSAHFVLGRCGTPYLLVPTEMEAWHATWWNGNSVGIEIDNIGMLTKKGSDLCSAYGSHDAYCTPDETNVFWEVNWPGRGKNFWATWPEDQYRGAARLIKAICHKHQIPRVVQPDPTRYQPFRQSGNDRARFKGICTHMQIDPSRRVDIGPFIDWDKLIRYAELEQTDCFNPPAYAPPGNPTPVPGGPDTGGTTTPQQNTGGTTTPQQNTGGTTTPQQNTGGTTTPQQNTGGTTTPQQNTGGTTTPQQNTGGTTTQEVVQLAPPVRVDDNTVRVNIGKHGGRVAFTVRKPGEPVPTAPAPGELPPPQADGKRDEFIRHAMNFQGAPYKAGSFKPNEGIDGVGLVAICLQRVGLIKDLDEQLDGPGLYAMWGGEGGSATQIPACILPGDLAFFGKGSHDTIPAQYPMVYLGGGRILGPVPNGGANDGAVQILHVKDMPESFAGWTHIDDLGVTTTATGHPGEGSHPGDKLTGALLPLAPAARYDALKAIVEKKGGTWDADKNKVNLVGIKSMAERCFITAVPEGWNDTLYAAFLDDDGNKCCLELKASLSPENDKESDRPGTWQLQEGTWKFKVTDGEGTSGGKALQPEGKIKGWLDKNGDGAPRGGDLTKPSQVEVEVVPTPDHMAPDNPDNPEVPHEQPGPAPVYTGSTTARTTGAWEDFIGKDDAIPDAIIDQIKAARGRAPKHKLTVTKFGNNHGPYIRVYYAAELVAHNKYLKDYMTRRIASTTGKVDKFIATCYRTLLGREGSTASLNLYDNMIVTWGTGFGANNGGLMILLDHLQKNEGAKNFLRNVGFLYDHSKFAYHVVDVRDKKVKSSVGKKQSVPLEAWRQQDELLYAFTQLATQEETRDAVTEANLWTYALHSGAFPHADKCNSQGAYNFISHLFHWCPGYAGGCVGAAISAGKAGDDLALVTYCAQHFVRKHHASSSPLNLNWNQFKLLWNEMKVDGLSVPDASTVAFGI